MVAWIWGRVRLQTSTEKFCDRGVLYLKKKKETKKSSKMWLEIRPFHFLYFHACYSNHLFTSCSNQILEDSFLKIPFLYTFSPVTGTFFPWLLSWLTFQSLGQTVITLYCVTLTQLDCIFQNSFSCIFLNSTGYKSNFSVRFRGRKWNYCHL